MSTKIFVCAAAALLLAAVMTSAASIEWTGFGRDLQWQNSVNWNTDTVPGSGDDVTIHTSAGMIQATAAVSINSLIMGDKVTGTANVTAFSSFTVFQQMNVYSSGQFVLASGASALSATANIQGLLTFASGTISGTASVSGFADLSSGGAKTISNGALLLSGPSTIGGVLTLSGQAALTISGASTWAGPIIISNNKTATFDTTKATVTLTGSTFIQSEGSFGTLNINSGVNISVSTKVSFAQTLHVPAGSYFITIAPAVTSLSVSGRGTVVASGKSTTFGQSSFEGTVSCQGQSCVFANSSSTISNLVLMAGSLLVATGTTLGTSITTLGNGIVTTSGTLTADHLNIIGAGSLSGLTVAAKHLYVNVSTSYTLNGGVSVSGDATFDYATISFGPQGLLHLAPTATAQNKRMLAFNGPPKSPGLTNNGAFTLAHALTSTNINLVGAGSWSLSGATLRVTGAQLAATTITLAQASTVSGANTCLSIGTLSGGTIKAKIDSIAFQASSQIKSIAAGCTPLPTNVFSFTA